MAWLLDYYTMMNLEIRQDGYWFAVFDRNSKCSLWLSTRKRQALAFYHQTW